MECARSNQDHGVRVRMALGASTVVGGMAYRLNKCAGAPPPPPCPSYALVQATVGAGTLLIWDLF